MIRLSDLVQSFRII